MAKLTEWYPGHIKPVRVGVYERWYGVGIGSGFAYWTGMSWKQGGETIGNAVDMASYRCNGISSLQWRGLASDPEKGGQ